MPIAVMIEFEREHEIDQRSSCATTRSNADRGEAAGASVRYRAPRPRRGSRASPWRSGTAPPPIRMMSRQDSAMPNTREHRRRQAHQPGQAEQHDDAEHEGERQPDLARPLAPLRSSSRETRTEMNTTLSMPSTISSAVSVASAARRGGRSAGRSLAGPMRSGRAARSAKK